MFIYFWQRERERARESMNRGGAEREEDTESEAGSRLWAVSTEPDAGLELTDSEIVTWAEVGSSTDWATQVPQGLRAFNRTGTVTLKKGTQVSKLFGPRNCLLRHIVHRVWLPCLMPTVLAQLWKAFPFTPQSVPVWRADDMIALF